MIKGCYIDKDGYGHTVEINNKTNIENKASKQNVDNRELSVICFRRMINIAEYEKRNGIVKPKLTAKEKRERLITNIIQFILQEILGFTLIVGTFFVCNSGLLYDEVARYNDWTIAFITIPLGIFILLFGFINLTDFE